MCIRDSRKKSVWYGYTMNKPSLLPNGLSMPIEILSGALRGVGDAWIPMFITGIGICGVRIVWMTAVLPHFHSLKGAAFCYPLSWVITTIAYFIYYLFFSQLSKRKELRSI